MKIALGQVHPTADIEGNRALVARLSHEAAADGADLILFPEMSLLEFFPRRHHQYENFKLAEPIPGPTLEWVQRLARQSNLHIVYNHYERSTSDIFYDTSVVVDRRGRFVGRQRMMHIAEEPGYNEKFYYTPGCDQYNVFDLEGWRLGIAICYDRHFPEVYRQFILQGARLVLIPTAVAAAEPFAEVYEVEARGAAVTHGVYVAMANRAGIEDPLAFLGSSMVIDPFGRIQARLDNSANTILTCELDSMRVTDARTHMPFLRDRRPETYGLLTRPLEEPNDRPAESRPN